MKLSYEDLISGDSILINGVGHIRSPYLWELKPTKGIGYWRYNFYINLISWKKDDYLRFLKSLKLVGDKNLSALEHPKIQVFDLIRLIKEVREGVREAMSFFMDEELTWNSKGHCFDATSNDGAICGSINRHNFEEVRELMLQLNYISSKANKEPKFKDEKSKELWEKVQKYQQKLGAPKNNKLELGNIISKLCSASNTYNLLNVYGLTVYQLYDQFFQTGYLRAIGVSEMAYSNHGGKKFKMETWMNPINKE